MGQDIPVEIKALMPGFTETIKEILSGVDVSVTQLEFEEYIGIGPGVTLTQGNEWYPRMYVSPRPYDTALEAAEDFFTSMRNFVANDKPVRLQWRAKPEIRHQTNFDTFKEEFVIYARLFYLPTV